ncbi:MAG: acetyl-CoA carboxylase biotin carboxyl carrier protein [Rhodobacteraceae bacterium]|nr:acetyl-CoA carboxylase biotin carboxyl carrier protein [Paracoccaceae bacterium]
MSKSEQGKSGSSKKDAEGETRAEADVAFIEALARILRDNDLAELDVTREYGEDDELQVRLSRYASAVATAPVSAPALTAAPAPVAPIPAPAAAEPASENPADHPGCVTSPMVGTVYLAPEPTAGAFVQVGDSVAEGDTLLIIEAMKTMNHIPAPRAGVVKQVLVSDAQPVEFGAPMLILE